AFCEIFQIHLVNDADPWRNELERFERLLSPFQKLIALAVALEFHFQIELKGSRRTEEIHLHRVIDHQIDRHEWLNDFGVAAESLDCAAHRGQIDNQRHAGEILENDTCHDEWNFFVRRLLRVPVCQRFYIFAPDFLAVTIAQYRFEHDPNAHRQPRNFTDTLLFQH